MSKRDMAAFLKSRINSYQDSDNSYARGKKAAFEEVLLYLEGKCLWCKEKDVDGKDTLCSQCRM